MKVPGERSVSDSRLCNRDAPAPSSGFYVVFPTKTTPNSKCLCEGSFGAVAAMRTGTALRSLHGPICVLSLSLVPCWVVFVGLELLRSSSVNPYLRFPRFPSPLLA